MIAAKPITQLQPEDLVAFPIWEFAIGEEGKVDQDETWVRPVPTPTVPLDAFSLSVVARFVTASGEVFLGIVGVSTVREVRLGPAALLTKSQYIFIPASSTSATTECQIAAASLGLRLEDVFPLRFTLGALVTGEIAYRRGSFTLEHFHEVI